MISSIFFKSQSNRVGVTNKKVLIVTSDYPPSNGVGGVIRVAKLVKYLPSHGFEPIIITTTTEVDVNLEDPLLKQIADIGQVHRLPRLDIRKLFHGTKRISNTILNLRLRKRINHGDTIKKATGTTSEVTRPPIASLLILPDHLIFWALFATIKSLFLGWFKGIDIIYATSPLQSSLLVGYMVKCLCRIPLIVEMRDPWTTNPFAVKRLFSLLGYLEQRLERLILSAADRIIVINEHFIEPILQKYPRLSIEKFVVIPNGFDEDDFKGIAPIHSKKKVIVHAGKFYQGRSGLPFLQAFSSAVNRYTWIGDNWEVKLIGSGEEYSSTLNLLGISHLVEIVGTVPHSVALQYVMGGDLLLLVPGGGLSTMTGKLFEYLAARKPIIVLGHDSAAGRLVSRLGIGSISPPDNIEQIAETLAQMMDKIQTDGFIYPEIEEIISEFERKGIVRRCVEVMEEVITSSCTKLPIQK